MNGAYAFEYDDMESDYWDGARTSDLPAIGGVWIESGSCEVKRCDGHANRWGVCEEHSRPIPPPAAKTGITGVFNRGGKYAARLAHGGTEFHLGTFPTIDEAAAAIASKRAGAAK